MPFLSLFLLLTILLLDKCSFPLSYSVFFGVCWCFVFACEALADGGFCISSNMSLAVTFPFVLSGSLQTMNGPHYCQLMLRTTLLLLPYLLPSIIHHIQSLIQRTLTSFCIRPHTSIHHSIHSCCCPRERNKTLWPPLLHLIHPSICPSTLSTSSLRIKQRIYSVLSWRI